MAEGVEYRVSTIYEARDNASRSLREIGSASRDATRNTISLADSLKQVGAAIGAYAGFSKAKALLVDYNNELDSSKTIIAGMLAMYTGQSIENTWDRASKSVERFQEMAAKSSLSTKELVETAQGLTRPLIQAGVKMKDIEDITFGVANAAKAFGIGGSVVAMDIEQAIGGRTGQRDRFMRSMLAQKGIELDYEEFNKKTQEQRIEILKKALTSSAISQMAELQSSTLSGQLGTLEDSIQIAFGKIGLPLVNAITAEVKSWNEWIDKNGGRLEEMGKSFSNALIFGFKTVKQVVSEIWPILKSIGGVIKDLIVFAANHKDTLIGLAKALIVLKVGEKLGGMAKGVASGVGGFFGGMGDSWGSMKSGFEGLKNGTGSLTTAFSNLGSVLSGAGGLIGAFAKLATLGYTLGGFLFRDTEEEKKQRSIAKGQVLAAREYESAKKEIADIEAGFKKLGWDPTKEGVEIRNDSVRAELERLNKLKADMAATEAKLIAEGKKAGLIKEEVTGFGERRVSLYNASLEATPDTWDDVVKGHSELMSQLTVMFKEKAMQSAREYGSLMSSGLDLSAGQWFGGVRGGFLGYYTEKVLSKKESYSDDNQAKPANQTINITIQRVMAKDPNRWLADMDDMVKQRQRAQTRAKGSWRSSPK